VDRPARSQSLYRLRYPGPNNLKVKNNLTSIHRSSSYRAANTLRLCYKNHLLLYGEITAVCAANRNRLGRTWKFLNLSDTRGDPLDTTHLHRGPAGEPKGDSYSGDFER